MIFMNTEFSIPDEKNNFEEYFSIFENINEAVCINTKEGIIFFVNRSTLDLFEYSIDEIIGMNITDLYANPEVRPEIINILENKGEIKDFPVKLKKKNGEIINCEFNTKVKKDEKGNKIFYGFIRDITKRKKIEDKIRESEEKYRTLFENASDSIFLLENGIFIDCNSKTLDIFHCRKEDLIGKSPVQVSPSIQPDGMKSKDKAKEKIQAALKGNPQFFEWRHRRPDGTLFDTEVSLNVIDMSKGRYILAIVRDVTERKIIEERIRKSEEKFRVLFDSAPIGICLLKDRRFQWINRKMAEILGYSPEELVGQNTRVLYDNEEEYDRVGKILYPSGNNANSMGVESILKRKDGTLINCSTSISALDPSDYSKGFITTLMDITDKKKLEQQIIKLAKFPSENPNPILRVSLDGELLYANNSSSELLSFWKINTGNKLPNEIINFINEALLSKKQLKKDIIVHDRIFSVTFVPFLNESYINIYGKDITDERKAEMALRESEEKHRLLFETMIQGVVYQDSEGNIISANPSSEKILGLTIDQMKGRTSMDSRWRAIHEDGTDFPGDIHPSMISLKTGNIVSNVLMGVFNPNYGEYRWININAVPLFKNNSKKPYLVYTTFEDITERKKSEAEILKYQNHLEDLVAERTARLEIINKELEAFSYSVSHDLRAPLRAIDGFGQALDEEYGNELGEEGKHYLKRIRNATIKMGNLIDDMLKLSRISRSTMKYEEVNLSQMTGEILSELKKSDPKREVKIKIVKDAIVNGDSGLLRIMLENLLNNAWKFTSKKENSIIEFGILVKEEKNIYFIRDNGVGFDMEYADKLFTPFHRLHSDEEFTGTGVGLANVNRIINMHGGKIWAEGKVGEGATFYFTI